MPRVKISSKTNVRYESGTESINQYDILHMTPMFKMQTDPLSFNSTKDFEIPKFYRDIFLHTQTAPRGFQLQVLPH